MAKKILIVEDNELNMRIFNHVLTSEGYETVQSVDGMPILEIIQEHSPDLIIMDIQLPVLSGLDLTKMIREDERFRHLPIVAVSAFVGGVMNSLIENGGFDEFLPKPISVPSFLETVARHLA
jgi:two-component system cell cycle response regulator DivK